MPKITDRPMKHFHLRLDEELYHDLRIMFPENDMSQAIRTVLKDFVTRVRQTSESVL